MLSFVRLCTAAKLRCTIISLGAKLRYFDVISFQTKLKVISLESEEDGTAGGLQLYASGPNYCISSAGSSWALHPERSRKFTNRLNTTATKTKAKPQPCRSTFFRICGCLGRPWLINRNKQAIGQWLVQDATRTSTSTAALIC